MMEVGQQETRQNQIRTLLTCPCVDPVLIHHPSLLCVCINFEADDGRKCKNVRKKERKRDNI